MLVYAGIDEAGYGPFFGPLTVGCCVLRVPKLDHDAPLPDLWARLNKAVCRRLSGRNGRVVVNDSKKLTTRAAGIAHLELGCLAFASLLEERWKSGKAKNLENRDGWDVGSWLDAMGQDAHRSLAGLPWYSVEEVGPWAALPVAADAGELAVGRGMLKQTSGRIGVEVADLRCAVVFEDQFNRMVDATRSKAATSFTFVAGHLQQVWQRHGHDRPTVVVDRQSGRMRYRDVLAMNFDGCSVSILEETPGLSSYLVEAGNGVQASGIGPEERDSVPPDPRSPVPGPREMTVHFQTEAEQHHMPVALASMLAKYNRELLMARFQTYFTKHIPGVAPTKGYGSDAKRFWKEVQPHLARLKLDGRTLRRHA